MPSLQRPLPRLESFLLTPFCQAPAFVGFWSRSQWRTKLKFKMFMKRKTAHSLAWQLQVTSMISDSDQHWSGFMISCETSRQCPCFLPAVILQCGLHKIESHGFSLLREPSEVLSLAIHMWRPRRCCGPCLVWYVWSHVLHMQHMQPCNTCKTRNTRHTRNTRKTRNFKSDLNISGADCSIQVALIWIWLEDLEPWLSSRLIFKSFIVFHTRNSARETGKPLAPRKTKKVLTRLPTHSEEPSSLTKFHHRRPWGKRMWNNWN